MEKEFVPYELAVKLKALGFDEPCFGFYNEFDNNKIVIGLADGINKAPIFSQAFRWFRDKYQLQGYIYSTTIRGNKDGKSFSDYCWTINGVDLPFLSTDARYMENISYEEAQLACLEKLVEIVKLKQQ